MRMIYRVGLCLFFLFAALSVFSQNSSFTGINGTVINLPCGSNCNTLPVQVPHLKADDDYTLVNIPYDPVDYVTPTGNELNSLYSDDKYSPLINLPFPVCFYGAVYSSIVVGSNGIVTFNATLAGGYNAFQSTNPIPNAGYPAATIMGVFTDLNPNAASSPNDRKIEWRVEGMAPFRKFIVSYYHVGMYGAINIPCSRDASGNPVSPTTFQIIIHEQSGLIDIFIENKTCHTTSSGGKAILGIQNWQKNKAVFEPARNATVWPAVSNEGWRFIPSGNSSRFSKAEIYDMAGNLLQTTTAADTATSVAGMLDINFNNICFSESSKQFVVKTYYTSCPLGSPLVSTDTITARKGELTAATSATPAGCSPSGSVTMTLPAGSGSYTFSIGSSTPISSTSNTHTFTGLIAGNYTVTGTNASGCSVTKPVAVWLSGTLNIKATPVATSCPAANNGSILIQPQNGTPPFLYNINNGAFQPGNSFTNLSPGTYIIGAKDSTGCVVANHTVIVPAGPAVTASVAATNVQCNNANDGRVIVSLLNATVPLQFSLDGITYQTSNSFTGLAAGNYTVYFKDSNNCSGAQTFVITQPAALSQSLAKKDVSCYGENNGVIKVSATGGSPGYTYSLDGLNYQASDSFNVVAGSYTVFLKDAANCVHSDTVTIYQPALLRLNYQLKNASCNGGADGQIVASANGGAGGFGYSIDGTNFGASNTFNVTAGNYTLTVKDANGCIAFTNTSVELTNDLVLTLSPDTTICEGTFTQLRATTNAAQFSWSPAVNITNATIADPFVSPADTTQYVVTVTLGACQVKDSVMVNVSPAPFADAGNDAEICFGQDYVLQGNGGAVYEWSPTAYFNDAAMAVSQNPTITPSQTINYSLMVTDAAGCKSLDPDTVKITVTPPIKVKATPKDTVVAKGDVFQLRATSPVNDYIWSPGFGLDNAGSQNPTVTVDRDINYYLTAYTNAGCKGTDTVRIKVYNGPEIYVPGGFTPNGDGRNDVLKPFPVGIKELHFFRVYNRWGELVFQTKSLNAGWDGKVGGMLQPVATYVWVLEAITKDNRVISKKGTTTLIR